MNKNENKTTLFVSVWPKGVIPYFWVGKNENVQTNFLPVCKIKMSSDFVLLVIVILNRHTKMRENINKLPAVPFGIPSNETNN